MMVFILIVISILLVLGIIYTIYSIWVAEVDEGQMEENFDEKSFVKPPGWKVGEMPKDLPKPIKIAKREEEEEYTEKTVSVKELVQKFDWERFSNTKNSKTA